MSQPTTFVLLLRGINVGGNGRVPMAELRDCLEKAGYTDVRTYINSGNVIFNSTSQDAAGLTLEIETILAKQFNLPLKIVLLTARDYLAAVKSAPKEWGKKAEWRYNALFVRPPLTAAQALELCGPPKPGIETAVAGHGVIFISNSMADAGRTNYAKLPGRPVYKELTIRNYNTTLKLVAMLNEKKLAS